MSTGNMQDGLTGRLEKSQKGNCCGITGTALPSHSTKPNITLLSISHPTGPRRHEDE